MVMVIWVKTNYRSEYKKHKSNLYKRMGLFDALKYKMITR